jgi:acetylornithine deacetylase/succinyl-diaminopimelate desuccinylase-like protein
MDLALHEARAAREAAVERMLDLLSIPSVSTASSHREDVQHAARWLAERLREAGMAEVRIDQTAGHPVVYGERVVGDGRPTVLIYGHYDVQPPDPLAAWHTPPFEPVVRDDIVFARGSADDKGQLLAHVEALGAWHRAGGPPTDVKVVFEGEEEIGSPHLAPWLREHAAQLQADVAVISDSAMVARGVPSIVYGLRGLAYMEIEVQGPRHDLHSGQYGGAVLNPAGALARILAALQDENGTILIPGFYDAVRPLQDDERAALAKVPVDMAAFRAAAGDAGGWGEPGYSIKERIGARPSLDINGLHSGWTGEGAKTVLPERASAKVSMRLVPDQDPEDVARAFEAHVRDVAPAGVHVEVRSLHGAVPAAVSRDIPAMAAAARAYEIGFGRAPVFTREGGSIPVVADFETVLGLPTILMGFGLPDDNLHGPNEKFELAQFYGGIDTAVAFHATLAAAGGASPS